MTYLIDIDLIEQRISEFEALSFRDRRKLARQVGHWAYNWEESNSVFTPVEIDILTNALELGERFHDWPGRWTNARFRLLCLKREMLGVPEPRTVTETVGKISVEMGSIVFHDANSVLPSTFYEVGSSSYKSARAAGKFYDCNMGGDGDVKMRLRFVDGTSPLMRTAELRRSSAATPAAWVNCPSKCIAVSGGENALELGMKQENVLIACYIVGRGRLREIISVICRAGKRQGLQADASLESYFLH